MNAALRKPDRRLERSRSRTLTLQRLARLTGFLYLLLAVCGMFAPTVLELLVVPGDAAATAARLSGSLGLFGSSLVVWAVIVVLDVALAVTLYLLLEPLSRTLSLVAAALRLTYSAVLGGLLVNLYSAFSLLSGTGNGVASQQIVALAALETFDTGFLLALVLFGVHLFSLGVLVAGGNLLPRVFGILLVAAGVGYAADSLAKLFVADYGGWLSAVLLTTAIVGELGLTVWLLVKGVRAP